MNRGFVAAVFLGLILALGAAGFASYFRTPLLEHGDIAANALRVGNAKAFAELYGNYSRFEFNHPGPAFFYVYAVGEWLFHDLLHLSPSPGNAHLLACMMLQSLFFAAALGIFCAHLPGRALPVVAVIAGAVYFALTPFSFMSLWPPHVLTMPVLCYVIACLSISCGRFRDLPWAVLAGGFAFHGHVAQALFVGGLGALTLALVWRRHRAGVLPSSWREIARAHRRRLLLCALLIFAFALPLLIDVVTLGLRSNVATIFGRFLANADDGKSLLQSLLYFISFGTSLQDQESLFTTLGPKTWDFFGAHAWRLIVWLAVFVTPPLLIWRRPSLLPDIERRFLLTGGGFLFASIGLCVLWGKAQAGPMVNFNGYFYYGIFFFSLLLACGLFARHLDRLATPSLTVVGLACAAVTLTSQLRLPPISAPESHLETDVGVAEALKADPSGKPKLLAFEHVNWPDVVSVALALQRRGMEFKVWPWWSFMFERHNTLPNERPALPPEMTVWWITAPGPGGVPITPKVSIHTQPAPLDPGSGVISFREWENGFRYIVSGITVGNEEYAATNESKMAVLFAPQPAERDVRVTFHAKTIPAPHDDQPAEVCFNGESLGLVRLSPDSQATVIIPATLWNRSPQGLLELRFPNARARRAKSRPDYEYRSAWLIWQISFETPAVGTSNAAAPR